MILKASQRAGARQLARHLLRLDENDHVEVLSLRGFMSLDLTGALTEAEAVARGTRCKKHLFSLSLNPPKDSVCTPDDLVAAIERAELVVGLSGQPRAVVLHEKCGRLHAHAVWSRIDCASLKAVPMSFFKTRLAALSKTLFLDHGWELPAGHKQNGWKSPDNFTLAEWQQAKRIDLDPRELKALFRRAWSQSRDLPTFRSALAAKGYFLARGDRRTFVAVDIHGEVFSVARMLGIRTRDVAARLGAPDGLPSVAAVKASLADRLSGNLRSVIQEARRRDRLELAPLRGTQRATVVAQRYRRRSLGVGATATNFADPPKTRRRDRPHATPGPASGAHGHTSARARTRHVVVPAAYAHRAGEPTIFLRAQRPGESHDAYMAYRRACYRLIDAQQEERRATQRRIEEILAAQRARRFALMARIAQLVEPPGRSSRAGRHP